MVSSFLPKLVNGPFDDPGLFIPFSYEKRALLFDLGDISSLSSKDLLKISHVFISHTHMDHFIGFDFFLRLLLGREKELYLYGPPGFIKNIEGKLAGYTWNLVQNYTNRFILHVTEVHPEQLTVKQYECRNEFRTTGYRLLKPFSAALLAEPACFVSTIFLDHGTVSLGFCLEERFHVNINKDALHALHLEVGPWLNHFKQAVFDGVPLDTEYRVPVVDNPEEKKSFLFGELVQKIAIITPGQKITYITDMVFSETMLSEITTFAKDSDHLFIEAVFLDKDRDMAAQKKHLTAEQAGMIAGMARAKQFTVFHFSPRYMPDGHLLKEEALAAYSAYSGRYVDAGT